MQDRLDQLAALRSQGASDQVREQLASALADRSNLIVAKSARIAGELRIDSLGDAMQSAFARFLIDPAKSDKSCAAKAAIAQTLYEMGIASDTVFLRGIRHVQMEPAFGGPVDSAAELRGICALGLVRTGHRKALLQLADLLADPELQPRIMAVRALIYLNRPEAVPLLRLKALSGDRELDVLAECFVALLKLDPGDSVEFVARWLKSTAPGHRSAAALALGESRLIAALPPLAACLEQSIDAEFEQHLLLALALLRSPESIDQLIDLVASAKLTTAIAAVQAMQIYRPDPIVWPRLLQTVQSRGEEKLTQAMCGKNRGNG